MDKNRLSECCYLIHLIPVNLDLAVISCLVMIKMWGGLPQQFYHEKTLDFSLLGDLFSDLPWVAARTT